MTLEKWLEKMEEKSAVVKKISTQLAIAYWTESRESDERPCFATYFSSNAYVCFNVFYRGMERTEEVWSATYGRFPDGWGLVRSEDVEPAKFEVSQSPESTLKIMVSAKYGRQYTLTFHFSK